MAIWSGLGLAVPLFWVVFSWVFVDVIEWKDYGYMLAMFPTAAASYNIWFNC